MVTAEATLWTACVSGAVLETTISPFTDGRTFSTRQHPDALKGAVALIWAIDLERRGDPCVMVIQHARGPSRLSSLDQMLLGSCTLILVLWNFLSLELQKSRASDCNKFHSHFVAEGFVVVIEQWQPPFEFGHGLCFFEPWFFPFQHHYNDQEQKRRWVHIARSMSGCFALRR